MTVSTPLLIALVLVVGQRLAELRLARHNERWARARGAREHGARHYPLFFVVHVGWLLAWPLEAVSKGAGLVWFWPGCALAFVLAQALRYWAIATLGRSWNTRVLVIPGAGLVTGGPYRLMRHPNYMAVVIELAAVPLAFGAWWTATSVGVLNLVLLLAIRIPCEEGALERALTRQPKPRIDVD